MEMSTSNSKMLKPQLKIINTKMSKVENNKCNKSKSHNDLK